MPNKVTIYRATLGKKSETFIPNQAKHLTQYAPNMVGYRCEDEHSLGKRLLNIEHSILNASKFEFAKNMLGSTPLQMKQYLEKINPNLIHAHFGPDGTQMISASKSMDIPLVTTLHGFEVFCSPTSFKTPQWGSYHLKKRALAKYAKVILCVSDFLYKAAKNTGTYKNSNLVKHHIGVDYKLLNSKYDSNLESDQICFVGRLAKKKGIKDFVEVISKLREDGYKNPVKIIGDGPDSDLVKTLVKQYSDISWLGSQEHEVVLKTLNESCLAVLPSQTALNGDSESLGLVFPEAITMNCAPIGYNHGGVSEVTPTEFLVTEGSTFELYKKTKKYLNNSEEKDNIVKMGKKHIQVNFNLPTQTKLLEEIYDYATN